MTWLLRLLFLVMIFLLIQKVISYIFGGLFSSGGRKKSNEVSSGNKAIRGRMVKDPQCGMYVASSLAVSVQEKGQTLFFCSEDCRAAWWSENLFGENHPCWKGGKSFEPYPPEFNETFKQRIRARDNHSCAICRLFGNNVHHINYIKDDTVPSNCITLCYSCHAATNHNRDYWQIELDRLMIARQHHYFEVV